MPKSIRQTCTLPAPPRTVYEALMDSRKHAAFTGQPASISKKVGGKITAFGDYIEGKNLQLVPNRKIVQSWRGSDWPEGLFSKATFALSSAGKGTKLTFTQTGVPDAQFKSIRQGWKDFYWKPLAEWLANKK